MLTMESTPSAPGAVSKQTSSGYHSDSTDSDDSDVAFACMDFAGVDFGNEEEDDVAAVVPEGESAAVEETMTDDIAAVADDSNDIPKDGSKHTTMESLDDVPPLTAPDESNNASTSASTSIPSYPSDQSRGMKALLSSIAFPELEIDLNPTDTKILAIEKHQLLPAGSEHNGMTDAGSTIAIDGGGSAAEVRELKGLFCLLENGKYADILRSDIALGIFGREVDTTSTGNPHTMMEQIKIRILQHFSEKMPMDTVMEKCIDLEIIGIASLNLFLQLNYTGPSMDRGLKPEEGKEGEVAGHPLDGINPHGMFHSLASKEHDKLSSMANPLVESSATLSSISEGDDASPPGEEETPGSQQNEKVHSLKETNTTDAFHNAVLSELAVDGELPFQVCIAPYFLLLGRAILSVLAEPTRPFRVWSVTKTSSLPVGEDGAVHSYATSVGISSECGANFAAAAKHLSGAILWNARAVVAHRRLISTRRDDDDGQACPTLWMEGEAVFSRCLVEFCEQKVIFDDEDRNTHIASEVMLEWGLAQHHFRKDGRGKVSFNKALSLAKLEVEVTGAEGKRTKYQQSATAQFLVRAKPFQTNNAPARKESDSPLKKKENIEKQMIKHDEVSDDQILLEKIKFEEQDDNVHYHLSIQNQSILLALCLDVKNDNPMDGLTGGQMGGYLARVLNQHDDWMVYATALLERAWLECERTHGRERAILQIQALADQHSNRLTLTQSTFKSVEEDSAPAQDRLRNLHGIVYPPRWDMLRDLAERYAKLGVVTSAAEIFEELELWDEVVECYRIAGKESKAVEVVRARLAEKETPRMYAALGDLTKDPKYFERSLEMSNGKFYDSHVALGKFYFDKGDLRKALKHFLDGLNIKPLMPAVWFRVGTLGMQLKEWDTALRAFTEVVQQEPEEGDAWANVAAVHMHRKNSAEAYPALLESLKQNRNNWRVWVSKLYVCMDLDKYDEAVQTCTELLNLRASKSSTVEIPTPEEKCIRAIVGGSLQNYRNARASSDDIALDSSKRTLARVRQLLEKMKSSVKSEAWLYEVSAYFNEEMGLKKDVFNDLMKEYRLVQSDKGWEEDPVKIAHMTNLVREIFNYRKEEGTKESLVKCKLLITGVMKRIRAASCDSGEPKEVAELDELLLDLEKAMASG